MVKKLSFIHKIIVLFCNILLITSCVTPATSTDKSTDTSISIQGFIKQDNQLSAKFNHADIYFSYLDKVTTAPTSSWKLFSDIEGKNEITTKSLSLQIGDNYNYILVTSKMGTSTLYHVVLRRLNMFTVSFNTDGGTSIPSQQVQEESFIVGVSDPQKEHYTFAGWDYDFSEPVMSNLTVNSIWTLHKFTIVWKNFDGTVLETDINVPYGSLPTYDGTIPKKPLDSEFFFIFTGWSPSITSVTSDAIYFAEYTMAAQFGTYPQSKVTDSALQLTLNSAGGTLPTFANSQAWTSYGYYIDGFVSSYMWYIDLTNGGDEYRGVYFTSYRPYHISDPSSNAYSYQDDNGYRTSNVYWFKYEPITWRVLEVQAGKAFLMADLVLDSQDYHYSESMRTIGETTVYPSNYRESHIRSWLNDSFYNTAFSTEEKSRIQTTIVDNSAASTGDRSNPYTSANTKDRVFLLSYVESTNLDYNLGTNSSRQLGPSDYAKSQGVLIIGDFNIWWLRSPYGSYVYHVYYVSVDGRVDRDSVDFTRIGVVPALWILL